MTMDGERLERLVNLHFDQLLAGGELKELEQILLESSEARRRFWELAGLNAALRQWGQEQWGREDSRPAQQVLPAPPLPAGPTRPPAPSRPVFRPARPVASPAAGWLAAAAAVLVIGLLAWVVLPGRVAPAARAVAVLTSASQAVWTAGEAAPHVGAALQPGWLRLDSGFAKLEFLRGARVVIEGPAEFRLVSDNEGELRWGRLAAVVPQPAHGFQVAGGGLTTIDYGTEFGVSVPQDGPPEVHVFSGEVGVRSADKAADLVLKEKEGVRLDAGGLSPIPADATAFTDEAELARLERDASKDRFEDWRRFSRALAQRSDLVAYLDFEPLDEGSRSLPNLAADSAPGSSAAIVGAAWAKGRWGEKAALEFKGPDDRLRMTLPGTFASLTFFAWVRVEKTSNRLNGLVMGQTGDQLGETHWYLYWNGELGAGVRIAPRGHGDQWWHVHSKPVVRDDRPGEWTFLATVLDRASGTAVHYADGAPVYTGPMKVEHELRLGTVEIGNHGTSEPSERSNFRGYIDEVAIFSSALNGSEIREIYEAGRPATP